VISSISRAEHLLDTAGDRRGERVADVADHEAERARTVALAQRPRRIVAPEAEPADRLLHPLLGLGPYVRLAVDHARDGLETDAGRAGDVVHGRARWHAAPILIDAASLDALAVTIVEARRRGLLDAPRSRI
jgi:hypothetical protein